MMRTHNKLNVLILAAGLGTRLRPLTDEIPKPLVCIYDKSNLEILMDLAKSLGDVHLHANAHYLAEQIVREGERLGFERVWEEPEILGTAGPLRRIYAARYRGDLLILNGDVYCNFDLKKFVANARAAYEAGKADCSNRGEFALLAVDCPKVNTFRVGADGYLAGIAGRFGCEEGLAATFSGISWYSEKALSRIRDGEFDIREFWKQEIAAGRAPFVDMSQLHATWIDMGSPEGLMAAVDDRKQKFGRNKNEPVVNAGVWVPVSAELIHSVLYKGAVVSENEVVQNEIRGKDFIWRIPPNH